MRILCALLLANILVTSLAFKLLKRGGLEGKIVKDNPLGFGTAKYAVIIGIDGFGGEYLRNFTHQLPTLQTFFKLGAFSTRTRNLMPTVSAPNWAGYLTSMGVTQTGVFSNDWVVADGNPPDTTHHLPPTSGRGRPQTIFSAIKQRDLSLKTALYFTWDWFKQIAKGNPDIDDWFWGHDGITCGPTETKYDCANRQDWNTQNKTVAAIKTDQPKLIFVHFDAVDDAGHRTFWGSDKYYEMVREKDKQVAGILGALATTKSSSGKMMIEETIVAVVADHGGYRQYHGISPPFTAEVFVPLLLRGPGIQNVDLDDFEYRDMFSLDMPITVLNALGIPPGKYMRGRVLEEIYKTAVEV